MSDSLIKTLAERRQNIWHEAKELLDGAAAENRDLSAEESQKYDRLNADLNSLRARIDMLVQSRDDNRAAEEGLRSLLGDAADRAAAPKRDSMEDSLRSMLKGERRSMEISSADFGAAFRALEAGEATEGGNTIKSSFSQQLVEHLVETSGVLRLGPTVWNTATGETLNVPVTTSHGAAGAVAEEGSISGSSTDPAFAKRALGAWKFGQIVTVSHELVQDSSVDLLGYIARSTGRNVGLALGAQLIGGDGTTEPSGVITTATSGVTGTAAVAGVFTADNLIDLFFSVIAPYRNSPSAGWLMKDATLGAVRKLKDGASRYIFEPGLGVGAPDTILGKRVETDPNVPAVAATAKSVLFGDWSAFHVRYAGGVRFERSDDYAFNTDQVAFRALIRADSLLVDQTGAIKFFTGGAAS